MIDHLSNKMKAHASSVSNQFGQSRWGTVTSTRQTDSGYECKVMIQPEGVLSGWLPVISPYVGGGWGLVCPPTQGMQAFMVPDTGDHNHGVIVGLAYSTQNVPPTIQPPDGGGKVPVKPGQFAIVHKNGSYLLFNDDDVILVTNRDLIAKVGRDASVTVERDAIVKTSQDAIVEVARTVNIKAGQNINFSAPQISGDADGNGGGAQWSFHGNLSVTGDVSDGHGSLDRLRGHHNTHTHPNVAPPNSGLDPE